MAARICPHCKRRVDERVSKGLAVCLSCGQSLDAPPRASLSTMPPTSGRPGGPPSAYGAPSAPGAYGPNPYGSTPTYGSPQFTPNAVRAYAPPPPRASESKPSGSGTIVVVLALVATFGLFGIGVVAFFLFRASPSTSSSSTVSTSTLVVETPESQGTDEPDTTATAHPTGRPKPTAVPTFTIPTSRPTTTSTGTAGLPSFPLGLAFAKMDEATAEAEKNCAFASGPFGTTVVDVTFENDGRVGTLSRKPIGGTATGSCITAKFLAIHVGAFEGSARTFSRTVTITAPSGATSSTASTGTSRARDAGH